MKKQSFVRAGITFAGALLVCQLAAVQTVHAQGWPEAAPAAKPAAVVAAPAKADKKAANTAAPAAAKTEAPAKAEVAKAAPAKPAAVVKPAAAAKAPVVEPAPSDLAQALQRQSDVLAKLASELQAQRAVIVEQQDKIKAIEARGAAAASAVPAAVAAPAPAPAPVAAPAPVPAPAAAAAPAPAAVAAPAKAPAPAPAPMPAITVETGGMKLKMAGLFQGWYTTGNGPTVDSFRMRRAELKFSGDMGAHAKWVVMVDPAKALSFSSTTSSVGGTTVVTGATLGQSGNLLQDAFVSLSPTSTFSVELGQQKVPLGMEGVSSSGKLDLVDRALFMTDKARGGGVADFRDLGVMVRGTLFKGQLEYASGLFNGLGESMNDTDKNNQKDFATRIVLRPKAVKGLQFGGSFARDEFGAATASQRERQGVEFAYTVKAFSVKGEEMFANDGAIARRGGYVQVSDRLSKSVQVLFRFDRWDPDTTTDATAATVMERDWIGGITYNVTKSGVILQANYIHKTFMNSITPTRDVFMANLQTAW